MVKEPEERKIEITSMEKKPKSVPVRRRKNKSSKPTHPKKVEGETKEIIFAQVKLGQIFLFKDKKDKQPQNAEAFIKNGLFSYLDGACINYLKKPDITKRVVINNN